MRSMRCVMPRVIRATVRPEFLGVDAPVTGRLVALESYEGCVPTFSWLADSGHLYMFLPPHAFSPPGTMLEECVDMECVSGPIDVVDLRIEGPGFARIGAKTIVWKEYLGTVDWHEENHSLHLLRTPSGAIVMARNPRFQVGGEKLDLPKWKKTRKTWTLPCPPAA